tara:strand:+ start:6593 stop:7549 length:957 start_codon:yes stop_codon:yes gene_type:complete
MSLLINIIILIVSAIVLAISGSILVKSLSKLARFLRVSEYVIAFILMAFATSLPELFVGITSAINKTSELSLGTVIGSNIANITLVMGIVALLGRSIKIKEKSIVKDSVYMFIIALIPLFLMIDKTLSRLDGAILLVVFIFYIYKLLKRKDSVNKNHKHTPIHYTELFLNLGKFLGSLLLLLVSAEFIVRYAQFISIDLNIPTILIGLFLVAIGTSLPELIFETKAILSKHKEMALGNIMGSVVANSTAVLGVTALIHPITTEFSVFIISALFMIVSIAIFITFIISHNTLSWREGIALLMLYLLFIFVEFYIRGLTS